MVLPQMLLDFVSTAITLPVRLGTPRDIAEVTSWAYAMGRRDMSGTIRGALECLHAVDSAEPSKKGGGCWVCGLQGGGQVLVL